MNKRLTVKVLGLCLLCSLLSGLAVYAATPTTTFSIFGGNYPGAPSFTVFSDGSNYFAKNSYGVIAYSGTELGEVFNAVMSIANDGASVYITPAEYGYSTTLTVDVDYVTVYGDRMGTRLSQIAGSDLTAAFDIQTIGVTLHDLWVDGNYGENEGDTIGVKLSSADADYFTMFNCRITHFDGTLVALTNNNNVFDIFDNYITESTNGNGIFLSGSADGFIHGNSIGGTQGVLGIIRISTAAHVQITGNKIFGTANYYAYFDTPTCIKFDNNIVGGGVPYGTTYMIYAVCSNANYGYGNSFSGNTILGSDTAINGITLYNTAMNYTKINNNTFKDLTYGVVEYGSLQNFNTVNSNIFRNVTNPLSLGGSDTVASGNTGSGVSDFP